MAVLVNKSTRVICQGITGSQGTFLSEQAVAAAKRMLAVAAIYAGFVVMAPSALADERSDVAENGLEVCISAWPDTDLILSNLKSSGWTDLGLVDNQNHFLSRPEDGAMISLSATKFPGPGCHITVEGWTTEAARELAGELSNTAGLVAIDTGSTVPGMLFMGLLEGKPVMLSVRKPMQMGEIEGAALILIEAPG